MKLVLCGGLDSALTHFAMIGLAGILEEAGATRVRLWWQDGPQAEPCLSWDGLDAGEAVHDHASRHASSDSWVQARAPHGDYGLFSPRMTAPSDWQALEALREAMLNADLTTLDTLMISNLGEPGYWVVKDQKLQPDCASSRWEMKTRNRGEEFIGRRLGPLALVVATRDAAEVRAGLVGESVRDELGKDGADSRTSTGLTTPGAVDSALAWCGLWGISGFMLMPASRNVSATAGAWSPRRIQPKQLLIPVVQTPMAPAAWRALMAARSTNALTSSDAAAVAEATGWLGEQGVAGVCVFPIHVTDNPSAPERMILNGQFRLLEEFTRDRA